MSILAASSLADLAPDAQVLLALVAGSGLACVLIVAQGWIARRHSLPAALAERTEFPQVADQWLAFGYASVMLLFAVIATRHGGKAPASLSLSSALFTLAWQLGLYLPLLVRYFLLPMQPRPRPAPWQYLGWPLVALAATYLALELTELTGFYDWLIETTGCPAQQQAVTQFQQGSTDLLLRSTLAVSAVLIAPITEECCFRGFLYSSLRYWGGRTAATLASAAVFAAVHASLAQFLPLFLFGIVLCLAYEKARSLWLPIVVHACFNATTLISLIFWS